MNTELSKAEEFLKRYLITGNINDAAEGLAAERQLISAIGLKRLTNLSRGENDAKMRNIVKAAKLVLSLKKSDHPWAARVAANANLALDLALKGLGGNGGSKEHQARKIRARDHQG